MAEDSLVLKQFTKKNLKPCPICEEPPTIEYLTVGFTSIFYIYCPEHRDRGLIASIIYLDRAVEIWNKDAEEYANANDV